jgi:hypothetical protein
MYASGVVTVYLNNTKNNAPTIIDSAAEDPLITLPSVIVRRRKMFTPIACTAGLIEVPRAREGWKSLQFNIRGFGDLPNAKGCCVILPHFSMNGREWVLLLYPGGSIHAHDGYMSALLCLRSGRSTTATWEISVLDTFGKKKNCQAEATHNFVVENVESVRGWDNLIRLSTVFHPSANMLDAYGTLSFIVSIKDEQSKLHFVPTNPLGNAIQGLFLDKGSADVFIAVTTRLEATEDGIKKAKLLETFPAHSFILKTCAPELANLCEAIIMTNFALCVSTSGECMWTLSITDIKPSVFRQLLWYVYGGSVAENELKEHARDFIDAADEYGVVNLKLEAEAAYVKSTKITIDNVMDNLLYADAKNCALLKEAVIDFLADNGEEVITRKISFNDMPGNVVKDVLVAVARNKKEGRNEVISDLNVMRVSELRRMLNEKGLNVDGSRETMIEALKSSAEDS